MAHPDKLQVFESTPNPGGVAVPGGNGVLTDSGIIHLAPEPAAHSPNHSGGENLPASEIFWENDLLTGIPNEGYRQVSSRIELINCQPGAIIFDENDPGDCLYLIAKGSVKISKKGRAGQQETLAHLLAGDFFGEMALIDNAKRSAQAAAVGETILGRIDHEGWDLLLHVAPHQVLSNFTRSVTKRLRHNNQHFIEQMMLNERLSLMGTTISSIVHDMNNPISCILNACEVIRTKNKDELSSEMTTIIRQSVKGMEMMTRELIDFSRGRTQLQVRPLAIPDLVADLEPHFAKCRPFVEIKTDIKYRGNIEADRYRMVRVFGNLIKNAREAMGDRPAPRIEFSAEQAGENVRFTISDNGPGIPAELLPQIFEPFVTHGKADGTGLGLAISKTVVDAHHGTISVSSSDKGTTFVIDLPIKSAPAS